MSGLDNNIVRWAFNVLPRQCNRRSMTFICTYINASQAWISCLVSICKLSVLPLAIKEKKHTFAMQLFNPNNWKAEYWIQRPTNSRLGFALHALFMYTHGPTDWAAVFYVHALFVSRQKFWKFYSKACRVCSCVSFPFTKWSTFSIIMRASMRKLRKFFI